MSALAGSANWLRERPSALVLILANLAPLLGVLFFGAQLLDILFLYWAETGIIVFFALLKTGYRIVRVKPPSADAYALNLAVGSLVIMLYIVHAAVYMALHFVLLLMIGSYTLQMMWSEMAAAAAGVIARNAPYIGILALSHGYSFVHNFLGKREWESSEQDLASYYRRIIVLNLTIFLGTFAMGMLDAPVWIVALLVMLKIAVDLHAHLREHAARGVREAPAGNERAST